jgi:hypothetical protein
MQLLAASQTRSTSWAVGPVPKWLLCAVHRDDLFWIDKRGYISQSDMEGLVGGLIRINLTYEKVRSKSKMYWACPSLLGGGGEGGWRCGGEESKTRNTVLRSPCALSLPCLRRQSGLGDLSQSRERRGKLQLGSTLREQVNGNYGSLVAAFRKLDVEFLVDRFAGFLGYPGRERDDGS